MTLTEDAQHVEDQIGERGSLGIRLVAGSLSIRGVDGDIARVSVRRHGGRSDHLSEELLEVDRAPGTLQVNVRQRTTGLPGALGSLLGDRSSPSVLVEAEVPRGATIAINGVSADLSAIELIGEQRFRTVSGDVSLVGGHGSIRIDSVSGDAHVHAAGPVECQMRSVSGDLDLHGVPISSLRASSVSGDIQVTGRLAAGGEHRVETMSGDLSLTREADATVEVHGPAVSVRGISDDRHGARRRAVVGDGSATLHFRSMSGDLIVVRSSAGVAADPPVGDGDVQGSADALDVLQALERGEITVDEAAARLEGTHD